MDQGQFHQPHKPDWSPVESVQDEAASRMSAVHRFQVGPTEEDSSTAQGKVQQNHRDARHVANARGILFSTQSPFLSWKASPHLIDPPVDKTISAATGEIHIIIHSLNDKTSPTKSSTRQFIMDKIHPPNITPFIATAPASLRRCAMVGRRQLFIWNWDCRGWPLGCVEVEKCRVSRSAWQVGHRMGRSGGCRAWPAASAKPEAVGDFARGNSAGALGQSRSCVGSKSRQVMQCAHKPSTKGDLSSISIITTAPISNLREVGFQHHRQPFTRQDIRIFIDELRYVMDSSKPTRAFGWLSRPVV